MADPRYAADEPMPGSDRRRGRYRTDPVLVGDTLDNALGGTRQFPFKTWAARCGFGFAPDALALFQLCGSAAEAYFVKPFVQRPGVTFEGGTAIHGVDRLNLQVLAATYRIDAVVARGSFRLAIEIDGMAFHQRSADQVAADYLRQRRIVCQGYTVIRFTAPEVFSNAGECWRQVDLILGANS